MPSNDISDLLYAELLAATYEHLRLNENTLRKSTAIVVVY